MTPPAAVPIRVRELKVFPVFTTEPRATVPSWQLRQRRELPSGWIEGLVGLKSVALLNSWYDALLRV
jgi:hypothetical protein